jgi:hypothetical protein
MAKENQNQNPQFQIELTPEVAQGIYANLAVIGHSQSEFVIDFVSMLPGLPKAKVNSRIIMVPEHAKRLAAALADNIRKYEQNFGTIEMQQPAAEGPRTIAPFDIDKGEA